MNKIISTNIKLEVKKMANQWITVVLELIALFIAYFFAKFLASQFGLTGMMWWIVAIVIYLILAVIVLLLSKKITGQY